MISAKRRTFLGSVPPAAEKQGGNHNCRRTPEPMREHQRVTERIQTAQEYRQEVEARPEPFTANSFGFTSLRRPSPALSLLLPPLPHSVHPRPRMLTGARFLATTAAQPARPCCRTTRRPPARSWRSIQRYRRTSPATTPSPRTLHRCPHGAGATGRRSRSSRKNCGSAPTPPKCALARSLPRTPSRGLTT